MISSNLFVKYFNIFSNQIKHKIIGDSKLSSWRNYTAREASFNTQYTPSTTNDVLVCATINFSMSLGEDGSVLAQFDNGSGFITIATCSLGNTSNLIGNISSDIPITFIVPMGGVYKLIQSGDNISTITSVYEFLL